MQTTKQITSNKHYALALLNLAQRQHIDTSTLISKAQISAAELSTPNSRVETQKIAALVQLMWTALQDENLGLSQHKCPPGSFYMMGKLTIHQPNLNKALTLGMQFYNQYIRGYQLSFKELSNDSVVLTVKQRDTHLDSEHLLTELILMAWHRYASWLIGENIPIDATYFGYPQPNHADEYKFIFPSQHYFNQNHSGFSFNKHYLLRPNIQNEESLKVFMSRCPSAFFIKHVTDNSLSRKIRELISSQLSSGLPSIESVALSLATTPHTVRRKLKTEGSSYQQIKNLVRRDQALYDLSQLDLPISEIAQRTGFSESSVFIRAFKKWTGVSPKAYRKQQLRRT